MKTTLMFRSFILGLMIMAVSVQASETQITMEESEVKEQIARALQLNTNEISVQPANVEFVKGNSSGDSFDLKGKVYITWNVRQVVASDESMNYRNGSTKIAMSSPSLDNVKDGTQLKSVKIGYQIFEHLGTEVSLENYSSKMDIVSSSGLPVGSISGALPAGKIQNDFTSIKIGLSTNANLIKGSSLRLDLVGSVNGGIIKMKSTARTSGDVYNDAFGYSVGAEAGVKMTHKSGIYIQAGGGVNNKTLMPKTYSNGSTTSYNGNEKYLYVNVGYSFGGKR